MNRLEGVIERSTTAGGLTLVETRCNGATLVATLLDHDERLQPGRRVQMLFKETEVALGRDLQGILSLRNRHPARVTSVLSGPVLSRVELDFLGQPLVAVITSGSAQRLRLEPGIAVEWLVKANEMGVEVLS